MFGTGEGKCNMGEDEVLPLINTESVPTKRLQHASIITNVVLLLVGFVGCWPVVVSQWHSQFYSDGEVEQRAWTWAGLNFLWLAIAVGYTLFQFGDKTLVAAMSVLMATFWGYVGVLLLIQLLRGQMALVPFIVDAVLIVGALLLSVLSASRGRDTDSESTDVKKSLREFMLVSLGIQFLLAFLACWPIGLVILFPTRGHHEAVGWQLNSAALAAITLILLWCAFRNDSYSEQTKKAACQWAALMCGIDFLLIVFKWHGLYLTGHNFITELILLIDCGLLAYASKKD